MYAKWQEIYSRVLVILLLCLTNVSCGTSEEEFRDYTFSISNTSSVDVLVVTYYEGVEVESYNIGTNEREQICSYTSEISADFYGIICGIDSVKFEFPTGTGYLISENGPTGYDFSPIEPSLFEIDRGKYFTSNGRDYIFGIVDKDFLNAHILPE